MSMVVCIYRNGLHVFCSTFAFILQFVFGREFVNLKQFGKMPDCKIADFL